MIPCLGVILTLVLLNQKLQKMSLLTRYGQLDSTVKVTTTYIIHHMHSSECVFTGIQSEVRGCVSWRHLSVGWIHPEYCGICDRTVLWLLLIVSRLNWTLTHRSGEMLQSQLTGFVPDLCTLHVVANVFASLQPSITLSILLGHLLYYLMTVCHSSYLRVY